MSETKAIHGKLAALRSPLTETTGSAQHRHEEGAETGIRRLRQHVAHGNAQNADLEALVRVASESDAPRGASGALPGQLTGHARRLLENARVQVAQLKTAGDCIGKVASRQLAYQRIAPLVRLHRESTSLAEIALRTMQSLPAATADQLAHCEGIRVLLGIVTEQAARLQALLAVLDAEMDRLQELSARLRNLAEGKDESLPAFTQLAESIWNESRAAAPLVGHEAGWSTGNSRDPALAPARHIASHCLNVAQVLARVLRHDVTSQGGIPEAIAAALVHDVGMLRVPHDAWLHEGPLSRGQRRKIEAHVRSGVDIVSKLAPKAKWLHQALAAHHERMDGTGYPGGLPGREIPPLACALAVADVYAALTEARPHRVAMEPRAALSETLLQVENNLVDGVAAERLLQLSFYPVGTAVELADGALGIVVATHMSRRDHNTPARPVVELVQDAEGIPHIFPRYLDLNACEGPSVVRALPAAERTNLLHRRWCA